MNSFIHSIGTAVPTHAYRQMSLCQFMLNNLPLAPPLQEKLRHFYSSSGIDTRHSVLPDFGQGEIHQLFVEDTPASLSARMQVFQQEVVPLSLKAVKDCIQTQSQYGLQDITHLIAVSCTGLSAPGLDLMLLKALGLSTTVARTCVHYMGCYAALHALKQAHAICQSDASAVVLIVCTELCTLHFQQTADLDSLTSSLLFADGSAVVLMSAAPSPLQVKHFYSDVILDGWDDMAWYLSETGFIMELKPEVPQRLKEGLNALVTQALIAQNLNVTDIDYWALHPGGRKIVDLIEAELQMAPHQIQASREVLKNYGNMSSPTVLFVLNYLLKQQLSSSEKSLILSASFGPGLTMETMTLEYNA